jgi:ferredoxin
VHIDVDRSVCEGHGLCAQAAPEVYSLDDAGVVTLRGPHLQPSQESAAAEGARLCPVRALTVRR